MIRKTGNSPFVKEQKQPMVVNSITHCTPAHAASTAPRRETSNDEIDTDGQSTAEVEGPADHGSEEPIARSSDTGVTGNAKGVLRLLQEGHFKGVADVRLRINFHEEISALENERATQIAGEGLTTAVEDLKSQLEDLASTGDLTPEQAGVVSQASEEFSNSTASTVEELTSGSSIAPNESIARIRSQFEQLAATLNAALATDAANADNGESEPEQTVGVTVETTLTGAGNATSGDSPVPPLDDPAEQSSEEVLADIIAQFLESLDRLKEEVQATTVLPPITDPPGQGQAFARFMTTYDELRSPADASSAGITANDPSVDLIG
jgi:hypothetical protein